MQFGRLVECQKRLQPCFNLARHRRFRKQHDDGTHMDIVKLESMKKTFLAAFSAASLLTVSLVSFGTTPSLAFAKPGNAEKGKEVFEQCSVCHNADSDEKKMGPGLKGLFKKDKMMNGKKPTEENVRAIVNAGGNGMPAYEELLSAEERDDLLAYLKTL